MSFADIHEKHGLISRALATFRLREALYPLNAWSMISMKARSLQNWVEHAVIWNDAKALVNLRFRVPAQLCWSRRGVLASGWGSPLTLAYLSTWNKLKSLNQ